MSLLLFTRDPIPANPAPEGISAQSMSRIAGGMGAKSFTPTTAPASTASTFALNATEWAQLSAFSNAAMAARAGARDSGSRSAALPVLAAYWSSFDARLDSWWRARDAMIGLGKDIISYANDVVPVLYGRISQILDAQALGDNNPAYGSELHDLFQRAVAEANQRGERGRAISAAIGPFADSARDFIQAFNSCPRNPPIRIKLDEIPYLCLSVDGGGWAIAGDERHGDNMQLWVVEPTCAGGPYYIRTPDEAWTLMTEHVAGMEQNPFPMIRDGTMEMLIKEGPRPHLARASDFVHRPETMFWFTADHYIQPVQWPHHTLDCSGNDGWGQGTPVLNWIKNDGRNQKWKALPRSYWDVNFWDVCQTIAVHSGGIPSFQHLQGDWLAIANDLNAGINGALAQLDTGVPFIASLDIQATQQAWQEVAREAQMGISGLGG